MRASLLFAVALLGASLPAQTQSDLLLILDASGSMWGKAGADHKIVIARQVFEDLSAKLPDEIDLGLIAYGHRREGDCADIETVVPLGPIDKSALVSTVNAINPKGKTPITASIEQAVAAVKQRGEPSTIVLLSDGLETCGGDPCAAVAKAKQSGVNFLLHVIGFDLAEEDVSDLECAAQAGGGLYFDAKNAEDLTAALDQAVAEEEAFESAVSVKALLNGELQDALVRVYPSGQSKDIGHGRTNTSERTNPRIIPVPAGTYDIEVGAIGLRGEAKLHFKGVAVGKGETVEKLADFSSGELAVKVLRNGELSDAVVAVLDPATGKRVAQGRSYKGPKTNPKTFSITPGVYNIEVKSVEISSPQPHLFEGVQVIPGERVEVSQEFTSGTLSVGAQSGGSLIDAVVHISADGKQVAQGRTYTSAKSNPKSFNLIPGKYSISAKPINKDFGPAKTVELELAAGATLEQTLEF